MQADVTRRDQLRDFVALACDRFGQLDVLISNADIMPVSPLDQLRVDDWEAMVDVNIKSVLYGIAAALPVFREQGFGHFINTASVSSHAKSGCLCGYRDGRARHLGRIAPRGRRQVARDHHLARHHVDTPPGLWVGVCWTGSPSPVWLVQSRMSLPGPTSLSYRGPKKKGLKKFRS
jgi:short chain dehydrogenase